jgi:uncharacterized protein (TIGR02266 family)
VTERRQHPRRPVDLRVSYVNRGALARDLVTDLSPGGLFLRASHPLPVGTPVTLEVSVGEYPPILVAGEVVWVRPAGMGVQFTGVLGPLLHDILAETRSM